MDFARRCRTSIATAYRAVNEWCLEVVQWRNAYSVPYVMLANAIFCGVTFYAEEDTQKKCLAAATAVIPLWDILFGTVQNQSIIVTILKWPFQDLWRTLACVLFGMSIYGIDHGQEEEAFWCSAAASGCVLISPVYSYNQLNQKIYTGLKHIGETFKYLLQLLIVRPLIRIYEVLKYIVLFKWVPVLWGYLRSLTSTIYSRLDEMILRRARAFVSRVISVLRYWVCFHWVADLNRWLATNVYEPLKQKLLTLKNGIIYTVYGYWLRPLGRYLLGVGIRVSKAFLGLCNRCAIAIGNSVVWPVLVICYEQVRALSMTLYGILLAPVVNKVHAKYKVLEDMVFIYVLGPLFKRIIDVLPEKNPLAYESDKELDDFIPVEEEPEAVDSDTSVGPSGSAHLSSDDEGFLAKGLHHIDITDSDTSNEEFFIYPKTRRRKRVKEPVQT